MMRVARAALFCLAVALAGVASCGGLWVLWLSDDPILLCTGLLLLSLAGMTRRWSKPDRPPGRYDDVPLFIAFALFAPTVFALTFTLLSMTLMAILEWLLGFEALVALSDISMAIALATAGAFVVIAFRRARQIRREEAAGVPR